MREEKNNFRNLEGGLSNLSDTDLKKHFERCGHNTKDRHLAVEEMNRREINESNVLARKTSVLAQKNNRLIIVTLIITGLTFIFAFLKDVFSVCKWFYKYIG